jgi:hypothetical protein
MVVRNKVFYLLLVFLAVQVKITAQAVDKSILEQFDAGVIAKLFSITKHAEIDASTQLRMAQSIRSHDSTLRQWIIRGESTGKIDTLQQIADFKLMGMLSPQQLQTYKYNSNIELSNAIATGEAEYLRREYNPDSATFNELKKSIANKYNYIFQRFSDNYFMNQQVAKDYLDKLEGVYDLYKYFPLIYSGKFIKGYIEKLASIKEIPAQKLADIEHSFYNMLWLDKYADWNLAAENATRKHLLVARFFKDFN